MRKKLICAAFALLLLLTLGCSKEQSSAGPAIEAPAQSVPETTGSRRLEDLKNEYETQVYGTDFGTVYINDVAALYGTDGTVSGFQVTVTSWEGYNGNITFVVDFAPDGRITAVANTVNNEVPGKGTLCGEAAFTGQFVGRNVSAFVLNGDGSERVDGVTGATISSKASVNAINAAVDFFRNVIMKGT
ncbi:MAG: FMN-binding protein [Oscillospiraceae bacterium]|nr:FMN-binding protein [Oscillospiraceae bacterium]